MIKSISIDEWIGTTFNEEIVMNPTWADTLSFLKKLDGDKFTLVFFLRYQIQIQHWLEADRNIL
ncbi:hypothetical protein C1T20_19215 [Paenibacillus polymyxa]|nr:hypothetical protein C1T20_19215 [Paenibacillus polymyxa]